MKKLVENQFDESQINENELEKVYGGESGGCTVNFDCLCNNRAWADEDNQENIVF
jgi:bacteriocin-like protein